MQRKICLEDRRIHGPLRQDEARSNFRRLLQRVLHHSLWISGEHQLSLYRVCHGFRLTKRNGYLCVNFDHFLNRASFLKAAGALLKIGSSIKPYRYRKI